MDDGRSQQAPTLGELARRLDRAEQVCERRAAVHVDRDLYASERQAIRDELNGLGRRVTDLDKSTTAKSAQIAADLDARFERLSERQRQDRVLVLTAFVAPIVVGVMLWLLIGGGL
jgi:hypothetical protein